MAVTVELYVGHHMIYLMTMSNLESHLQFLQTFPHVRSGKVYYRMYLITKWIVKDNRQLDMLKKW